MGLAANKPAQAGQMNGQAADDESYDLAGLLDRSDLAAKSRRAVYDAIVSSVIEGDVPSRESVVRLVEFAAGRISGTQCRQQILGYSNIKVKPVR